MRNLLLFTLVLVSLAGCGSGGGGSKSEDVYIPPAPPLSELEALGWAGYYTATPPIENGSGVFYDSPQTWAVVGEDDQNTIRINLTFDRTIMVAQTINIARAPGHPIDYRGTFVFEGNTYTVSLTSPENNGHLSLFIVHNYDMIVFDLSPSYSANG